MRSLLFVYRTSAQPLLKSPNKFARNSRHHDGSFRLRADVVEANPTLQPSPGETSRAHFVRNFSQNANFSALPATGIAPGLSPISIVSAFSPIDGQTVSPLPLGSS